jgi:hypothetical protein
VDPLDEFHGVGNDTVKRRTLIGVARIGVAVGDDDSASVERGAHGVCEVGGMVGGIEKELRERVGVVVTDRTLDGLTVPRVGWLACKRRARRNYVAVPEHLPTRTLAAAVQSLQRDEHTPLCGAID